MHARFGDPNLGLLLPALLLEFSVGPNLFWCSINDECLWDTPIIAEGLQGSACMPLWAHIIAANKEVLVSKDLAACATKQGLVSPKDSVCAPDLVESLPPKVVVCSIASGQG